MVEINKVQEAMQEVDKQFEAARPMITTTARVNGTGEQAPATLVTWLRRFDEKQEEIKAKQLDLNRKLDRILHFLGATER